jgi:magnesium-transporting ATPase (P-type)
MLSGSQLPAIFTDEAYSQWFAEILPLMETVIVYRCQPQQKKALVSFIKSHPIFENPITAAVGDGANDISMLQAAQVSFGIQSAETQLASSCSDFSIAKFEDLRRLLFWHGRGFAFKASNFLMWSIFKNMLFCIPVVVFNSFSSYSGGTIVLTYDYALYNAITVIALLAYLFMDQDVCSTQTEGYYDDMTFSLGRMYLYKNLTHHQRKLTRYLGWAAYSAYAALVLFGIPWLSLNGATSPLAQDQILGGIINSSGYTGDFNMSAWASFAIMMNTYHLVILIGTRHFSTPLIISYFLSYLSYIVLVLVDEFLPSSPLYLDALNIIAGSFIAPLSVVLGTAMIALPIYALKCWEMVLKAPRFYQKEKVDRD